MYKQNKWVLKRQIKQLTKEVQELQDRQKVHQELQIIQRQVTTIYHSCSYCKGHRESQNLGVGS